MMRQPSLIKYGLLAAMLAISGCGGNTAVTGRVTFEDGTPLTVGEVILDDGCNMGRGTIKPDGSFIIGFRTPRHGIPAGTYRVAIYNSDTGGPGNWAVSPKYVDPQKSGIVFEVEPGKRNILDFQVEPNTSSPAK